jgi:hypothetical protein
MAAGRALKAYLKKDNVGLIRNKWEDFPATWTKRQIERVIAVSNSFVYKSLITTKAKAVKKNK